MACLISPSAVAPRARAEQNALRGGDGDVGRERTHLADRLGLGLGDLLLGHLGAARHVVLDPLPGLDAERIGLALGLVDDLLDLGFGLARLALVLGEKRLRLLAELARLVELGRGSSSARLSSAPVTFPGTSM